MAKDTDKKIVKNQNLDKAKAALLDRAMNSDAPEAKEPSKQEIPDVQAEDPTLPADHLISDTNPIGEAGELATEAGGGSDGGKGNDASNLNELFTSFQSGTTVKVNIADEMRKDFIDYSMSVIVSRALPDVRDGLKPSQRRILVVLRDLQLWPTAKFRKSAKISGDTTGNYHPHGNQIVYGTMVKMAQEFNMRYPLVDGQGNFGSIDGDMPAAERYTEARMTKITRELLRDLEKGTVLYAPNYDGTRKEPTVLPSGIPNLLTNGTEGIAVGMATKVAPHNLGELIDALLYLIEQKNQWQGLALYNTFRLRRESIEKIPYLLNSEPEDYLENYINSDLEDYNVRLAQLNEILRGEQKMAKELLAAFPDVLKEHAATAPEQVRLYPAFSSTVSIDDLMQFVKGPDFPTGGSIYNHKEIVAMYQTGRGRVKMRGTMRIDEDKKGNLSIIITEIPYQINKSILIQQIAHLVQLQKVKGIKDLRDESDRHGIRIVIELKSSANPKVVMNKIYKYTPMQLNFNSYMIALVDNQPQTLNLRRLLELYLEHRMVVVIRRLEFELAQARYRGHILEGYLKALDFIDEIIKLIRASKTQEEAKDNLMTKFDFTEVQAQAILEMQLRRLAALERQKIEEEYKQIKETIVHHNGVLGKQDEILTIIATELREIKDNYSDKRRTKVFKGGVDDLQEEDLVANERTFVTISHSGYVKRQSPTEYREQKRGGKGSKGVKSKDNDFTNHAFLCDTHDSVMLFTNKGRVFQVKAFEIPEASKQARGLPVVNLVPMDQQEIVTAVLTVSAKGDLQSTRSLEMADEDQIQEKQEPIATKYLVMATSKGTIKRTEIANFQKIRQTGLIAITLNPGDELIQVRPTTGEQEIILVTRHGKSIRFPEKQITITGRSSKGVKGMGLKKDDEVITMDVVRQDEDRIFVISEAGYGKFTELSKFRVQNRAGGGIFAFRVTSKTGPLVAARIFDHPDVELILVSKSGNVIRSTLDAVPVLNRQTSGVRIMKMNEGDAVVGMAAV